MPYAPFFPWRSGRCYPGDTVYFWSPTGQLPSGTDVNPLGPNYLTIDSDLSLNPPTRQLNDPNNYVMSLNVSGAASAGPKTVTWLDPTDPTHMTTLSLTVTVAAPPTSTAVTIPSGSTRAYIQAQIDAGHSPIILSPGDYQIDHMLTLNTGTPAAVVEIDGQGWASFTRIYETGYYYSQFFSVTNNLTLRGITFNGSQAVPSEPDNVLSSSPYYSTAVDVNVIACTFNNCSLGQFYAAPDPDTDVGGVLVKDCEFIRALLQYPQTGMVVNQCIFREAADNGQVVFYNIFSQKWLVIGSDWVRTARGIDLASGEPSTVRNGVVAACRFYDIAFGMQSGGGEVILFEKYDGGENHLENNAFVWCHMFNCASSGVQLAGGGINNNSFINILAHTLSSSIIINGYVADIYSNKFEYIEMDANLAVSGQCNSNYFNQIVARQNPHSTGGAAVARLPFYGYNDPASGIGTNVYLAYLPFSDTSSHSPDTPNHYHNLYLSYADGLVQVFQFPNIANANDAVPPP